MYLESQKKDLKKAKIIEYVHQGMVSLTSVTVSIMDHVCNHQTILLQNFVHVAFVCSNTPLPETDFVPHSNSDNPFHTNEQNAGHIRLCYGQELGEVLRHLWGRLGILLQRGNAAILGRNRLPTHPAPAVDGHL